MIQFLVVSTPRSGTRYTSKVLTKAGMPCGHEMHYYYTSYWDAASFDFFDNVILPDGRKRPPLIGDASWLAAPFLEYTPSDVVVVYQMRKPWDTLNSIAQQNMGREIYMDPSQWAPKACGPALYEKWPKVLPDRVATFWRRWHEIIEEGLGRFDNVMRWRLDDIGADYIHNLADAIGVKPVNVIEALKHDKLENTRGRKLDLFTPENTPKDILETWRKFN